MSDEPQTPTPEPSEPEEEQPDPIVELQERIDELDDENARLHMKLRATKTRIRNLAGLARAQRRFIRDMIDRTRIDDWIPGDPDKILVDDDVD